MSVNGRKEFKKWHNEQLTKNVQVDFQKELVEHCESGIKLLKEGCLTFKHLFEPLTKFSPFDYITIASIGLQPSTIASNPLRGWRMKANQSKGALEWLHWQELCLLESPDQQHSSSAGTRIQHAANRGEYHIPNSCYTMDGAMVGPPT